MVNIREQDPLKQGLKPIFPDGDYGMNDIREQDPLKQGLKLSERYDWLKYVEDS